MAIQYRVVAQATALVLFMGHDALAQVPVPSGSHCGGSSLGLAVTVNGTNSYLSSGLLGGDAYNVLTTAGGAGLMAKAEARVASHFGVELSYARSALGIGRQVSPGSVSDETVGIGRSVAGSELTAGLVIHSTRTSRRFCGYAAVKVGVYQFELASSRSRNGGVGGAIGFDVPLSRSVAAFAEFQITAIKNGFEPPLRAGVVLVARVGVGLRYRFP